MTGKASPPHPALFHNNHDGTFTDVAEKAGTTSAGAWEWPWAIMTTMAGPIYR